MNATHGGGRVAYVEAAHTPGGIGTALRGHTIADLGAFPSRAGAIIPAFTQLLASGPYRIPAISWDVTTVFTNTMATDAYRGAGRPEAAYNIERVMDASAAKLGLDRVEGRRRNRIPPNAFPYDTPTGASYHPGNNRATLDKASGRSG